MKWEEIRKDYPNQWLLMLMEKTEEQPNLIIPIELKVEEVLDEDEVRKRLFKIQNNQIIYHTSNEGIRIEITRRVSPRFR